MAPARAWTRNLVGLLALLCFLCLGVAPVSGDPGSLFTLTVKKTETEPLVGVNCYAFNGAGSYLGMSGATDSNGHVTFDFADGTYKFRVDYLGYQFWSEVYSVPTSLSGTLTIPHQNVAISVVGVDQGSNPMAGVQVYLFTETGAYMGQSRVTDSNGQVFFSLPDQAYKVRADYLGQQFWSEPFKWQNATVTIPMGDAEVTVTSAGNPLAGVPVYVFSAAGAYLGLSGTTDGNGKAVFTLPAGSYKYRADYQGSQYWSAVETVAGGQVDHITIVTAPETIQVPDVVGLSQADAGAAINAAGLIVGTTTQQYSDTVPAGLVISQNPAAGTSVEGGSQVDLVVSLGPLPMPTANITATPQTVHPGESVTLSWTSANADSCAIEPGIGSVALSGSLQVTPGATTMYIITATGPGGTATDSVEVQVIPAFEYESYGLEADEQEGGAGLVAGAVRILNGNVVEVRSDLDFPTPSRLGLSLVAVYNSRYEHVGSMGHGWTYTYEASLDPAFALEGVTSLKIIDGTAKTFYFQEGTPGEYSGLFGELSKVKAEAGGYAWYRLDGSKYIFSSSGRLDRIEDAAGNSLDLAYDPDNRLERVTDEASGRSLTFSYNNSLLDHISGPVTSAVPNGIWVTYGYDGNQNLTTVTYADGSGYRYVYNDASDIHNLTQKKDLLNHILGEWSYNSNDQATAALTPDGKGVTLITYSDTQVQVTDVYNISRTYTLAKIGGRKKVSSLTGITNAPYTESNAVRWVYDDKSRLTEVDYGGGTINLYQNYDERGNPGTLILASGSADQRTIQYTYHPEMNVPLTRIESSVLQGGGYKVTIWDYDNDYNATPNENPTRLLSRLIEQGYTVDMNATVVPYTYITTFTYDAKGQVLSIDGPRPGTGDTTTFVYNVTTGNLESVTQPLIGSMLLTEYNAAGRPGRVTDVNGQQKGFTYDGRGRITAVINYADNPASSTQFAYVGGLLDSVTDPDGVTQFFDYDAQYGRLSAIIDQEGNYISQSYETYPRGNLIERSNYTSSGTRTSRKRWSYEHPNYPGKLYREIQADDTYREYGYDPAGNVSSVVDPNGNLTAYAYDFMNRLISAAQRVNDPDPRDLVTSYAYDTQGNLVSVTDAKSNGTIYDYDDMGRVVSTDSPDTGIQKMAYDQAGNLKYKTDAKAVRVEYTYDDLNRVTAAIYPDSIDDITYTYDQGANGKGHLTAMNDPSGSTAFGYDARGRLVQKTSTINSINYPVTYAYTPGGRVSTVTYPSGRLTTYDRNSLGKISQVTAGGIATPLASNLTYRPFGGPLGLTNGFGGTVNNVAGECDCLTVSNPGQPRERTYGYDANRNLTSITGTSTPWYSQTFGYDQLNRLTSAAGRYGSISYTYDDVGNRLTRNTNGTVETYTYFTGTNSLQAVTGGQNPRTFSYDANGNITSDGTLTFIYDQSNQLTEVEQGANNVATYTYNGLGERAIKQAGTNTTIYHYDLDGKVIAESLPDGTMTREYLYMGKVRVAMVDVAGGNALYHYLNDRLGTPEILTDATGTVAWEAWYEPFGEAHTHPSSSVVNNIRLPGQYFDQETGLHYNYHRYYDPLTGRYLTPDPGYSIQPRGAGIPSMLPFLLNTPQELNLYSYTVNNPINLIDPSGLISCDGTWRQEGWDRFFNVICICYWLCVPCGKPVIWSGNPRNLPWTWGTMVHTGYGGGVKSGDECFCNKPGPEKECKTCE
jgi:RHS repeat-associated protein